MRRKGTIRQFPRIACLILLFLAIILSGAGNTPLVQAKDSFLVAVIDTDMVIRKSKTGSRARASIQERIKAVQNILNGYRADLQKLAEQLGGENSSLSDAERKRKELIYSEKVQKLQIETEKYNSELREVESDFREEYNKKIAEVSAAVAKRHGFSLVFEKGSTQGTMLVYYNKKGLDITNEVIKELDRRFK